MSSKKQSLEKSRETREMTRSGSRTSNRSDHNGNDEGIAVPVPPDGGWGWVITLSSFVIGMIVDGIAFTFGIFFSEFQNYFGANKSTTSSINSVLTGTYLSIGKCPCFRYSI